MCCPCQWMPSNAARHRLCQRQLYAARSSPFRCFGAILAAHMAHKTMQKFLLQAVQLSDLHISQPANMTAD